MHDGFLECINVENSRPRTRGWKKIGGSWKASLVRDFYGWLVGVQVMSVSLAVTPSILLIFSTVLNALMGSLVPSLITRSKRPVTGVTDSMLLTRLSWLTMCPSSPLALAKTKLVDADLDIFL